VGVGGLEVREVAEDGGDVEQLRVQDGQRRSRLGLPEQLERPGGVDLVEQRLRVVDEVVGEIRVEQAATPAADDLDRPLHARGGVQQGGGAAQRRQPGTERDVIAVESIRDALAVPPLVGVVDAALHLRGQAESSGGIASDLAGRRGRLHPDALPTADGDEREPDPFPQRMPTCQAREEGREHLPGVGQVGLRRRRVHGQLVTDELTGLVRVAGAADVVQQGRVQRRSDLLIGQVERSTDRGREGGGSCRLACRDPEAQIRQARQPRQQADQPHRHRSRSSMVRSRLAETRYLGDPSWTPLP